MICVGRHVLICDFHNDIMMLDESGKLQTTVDKHGVQSNKRIGRGRKILK